VSIVFGAGWTPSQLIRKRIALAPVCSRIAVAEAAASAVLRNGSTPPSWSLVLPEASTVNNRARTMY
jgi:hypothetical protein